MGKFLDLAAKRRIFFDGAMGTELQKRGLNQDPAILNLTSGEVIIDIHRSYLEAGANIITANTFGAYSHKYDNAANMIKAAMDNARAAIAQNSHAWLALDLGPTGLMLEPYGDTTPEECYKIFEEAVQQGTACGADLILIETMMDLAELELAITAAKQTGLPVFATMSFDKNGRTMMGVSLDDMATSLEALGVDAIGMNCGFGPDVYVELAAQLASITKLPIIVQPNAGMPLPAEPDPARPGEFLPARYSLSASEFAKAMAAIDAAILGGCCGTSPEHIAAIARL
ncbi:MAG: homocysteine S-methyltransferase family protein [Defluviitaleaceae bacterium]|nr:homocysteine S-methyltransferase family protein [Defluviitaleaceae bacterium]